MKKAFALLVFLALVLVPFRPAAAHDDPDIQRGIIDVLLFPFKAAFFVVTLPVVVVGGMLEKKPAECPPNCPPAEKK